MELSQQLTELTGQVTISHAKIGEEIKTLGAAQKATLENHDKLQKQVDAMDIQLAQRHIAEAGEKSIAQTFKENEAVSRLMRDRTGRATIELDEKQSSQLFSRKTTLLSSGLGSLPVTGVLGIDRMPGITTEARQALTIRDVLSAAPTSMQVVDYVKVNAPLGLASPQVEGSSKYVNAVTFTSASERIKTLATYIPASRQVLDDFGELMSFLQTGLQFYTDKAEELELLSGSNAGEHLNGLITQATAFTTGLLVASKGWSTMDIILRAQQQVAAANEVPPTFVVLHPTDWYGMKATKDSYGRYILGDPQSSVDPTLWGMRLVVTTNITAGTFLLGSGDPAASQIRDRMKTVVDISTEDGDNFTKNLITIRCEKRLALVVRRPASYITGSFTSSPA